MSLAIYKMTADYSLVILFGTLVEYLASNIGGQQFSGEIRCQTLRQLKTPHLFSMCSKLQEHLREQLLLGVAAGPCIHPFTVFLSCSPASHPGGNNHPKNAYRKSHYMYSQFILCYLLWCHLQIHYFSAALLFCWRSAFIHLQIIYSGVYNKK